MKTRKPHPMQPIVFDDTGVARFQANPIVRYILDNGGIDLNKIAMQGFADEDQEQFAMLIGYSVSGFSGLSYVSQEMSEAAFEELERVTGELVPELQRRIAAAIAKIDECIPLAQSLYNDGPDNGLSDKLPEILAALRGETP